MKFKAILETKGTNTGKMHRVRLLDIHSDGHSPPTPPHPTRASLPNAPPPPSVFLPPAGPRFPRTASLVSDDSLCKKISQLKYDDEKRANEPRVVLEVDYN